MGVLEGQDRLVALVRADEWFMRVLRTVRDSGLPDAWVGAGALRDLVWGRLYGHGRGFDPGAVRDIDVAFFDPADLSRDRDLAATAALAAAWPDQPWEAKNQAAVHTWYAARFGGEPPAAFESIVDAVATWPELATAVVVCLRADDTVDVGAPYGLDDLLGGVWRHNPARVGVARSRERLARHRPAQRWPSVTVIPPGGSD